jgi:hypothetical protein
MYKDKMASTTPLAYNTGSTISGTTQVGNLAVGNSGQDYSTNPGGVLWWNGPDEELGYVIALPVSGNTQSTSLFSGAPSSILTLSNVYKGTGITLISNQIAYQPGSQQQTVLGNTKMNYWSKVMFSAQFKPNSTPDGTSVIGFGKTSMNFNYYPGNDEYSIGVDEGGHYYKNGTVEVAGLPTWVSNDIVDFAINCSAAKVWIRVNGGYWNNDINQTPESGNSDLSSFGLTNIYPAFCPGTDGAWEIKNTSTYGVPEGYTLLGTNINASVGFLRTKTLTDNAFIGLSEYVASKNGTPQTFGKATDASVWLTNNGYWNSYPAPILYLDAGDNESYPGTGTVWTDLIGNKIFNLVNGPGYDSGNGGKIYFYALSGQYANCSTSLPSLPTFTTSVWHNWDGSNSGSLPCLLSEVYVGGGINFLLGAPDGNVATGGYFNGNFQLSPQFTLTPSTWYNIVVSCDGNQVVKIYLNGTLISSTSTTGPQPSSSGAGINLMKRWDGLECWGGYLSTVAIYDKPLTSNQVLSIFNATKSRYGL